MWISGALMPRGSGPAALRRARWEKTVAGEPEHHAVGRSRGGFGTKLHLVVDSHGIPLAAVVSPGQRHESKFVEPVLRAVRRYLRRRGIQAVIPTRKDQKPNPRFDRATYRRRNVIERAVGWLKENRRLATRYEKLAVDFLAMVKLAMIQLCLQLLDSSDRA